MENQQSFPHGFDMLNSDSRTSENIEVKTPSSVSSSADRSINEDEETPAKSESSSGGSSLSDLKKRLQHLPSPNEATRLANRVINISRRLSLKRDFCFHGETNRIDENIEKEETEEQDALLCGSSLSDLKSKDARTRRRAKIRLERARNRKEMVISKPSESETSTSDLKNGSNNDQRSDRSCSLAENQPERISGRSSESPIGIEKFTNNAEGYSSLYRNQREEANCDSSRSQRSAGFLHLYPNISRANSPKDRVELQPLSPSVPFSSPSHNKYRPCRGVILQNLSSGSEAESNYEAASDKMVPNQKIDCFTPVLSGGVSPNLSSRSCKIKNLDYLPSMPLSSRISTNHTLVDSSRKDYVENLIDPPVTRMNFADNRLRPNLNDPLALTIVSPLKKVPREKSFYRILDSSRSDRGRITKGTSSENVEEPMFFSAREEIGKVHRRKGLETPSLKSPVRDTSNISSHGSKNTSILDSPRNVNFGVHSEENGYNGSTSVTNRSYEEISSERGQAMITNEYLNSASSKSDANENPRTPSPLKSASNTLRSPESILGRSRSIFGDPPSNDNLALYSSKMDNARSHKRGIFESSNALRSPENIFERPKFQNPSDKYSPNSSDARPFRQAISKSTSSYDNNTNVSFPQSQDVTPHSQFTLSANENQSAVSSCRELLTGEFAKMFVENLNSQDSAKSPVAALESASQRSNRIASDKEFTDIPTLALSSQEMSYTTSPSSKLCSDKSLDTNALILALSNASLKQQTGKDATENSCSGSCADSKTVSRLESSENTDKRVGSTSSKLDETRSRLTTSRTLSCRSSLSMKSKIPVKVPTNRSKLSVISNMNESKIRGVSPMLKQAFHSNSSPPERTLFSIPRSNVISGSCESPRFLQNFVNVDARNSVEDVSEFSNLNIVPRNQEEYLSGGRCIKDKKSNDLDQSSIRLQDVVSRSCLSLQIHVSDDDKRKGKRKEEERNYREGDGINCDERNSMNGHGIGNTFRTSNFSNSSSKSDEEAKNEEDREHSIVSLDSELESTSSPYRNTRKSDLNLEEFNEAEEPGDCEESATRDFIQQIPSTDFPAETYEDKYCNTIYEGEVFERASDRKIPRLFQSKNQIGDGGHREMYPEDSEKLKFERDCSYPEEEEFFKSSKRIAEHRDKLRFSLEKLAADQFRKSIINLEQTKSIQSDTAAFFAEKFYDAPQFSLACSSSTSRLRHDKSRDSPRFKKKSQDRFPFTISEKTSVASMKFKVSSRLGNLDEDEEDTGYRLDTHPSITRLAGSGFEDSPADIISYAAKNELEDRQIKSSGMKGLVKKFSARLKKSKKSDDQTELNSKMTNVIYKNRDYREECESSVESCSESSLLREFKIYESLDENLCKSEPNPDSPDQKSTVICDTKSVKRSDRESTKGTPLSTENPCRRYDRDDLWVQAFKDFDSDHEERKGDVKRNEETKDEDESKSRKDPYSVFFVKSARETPETSVRVFLPKDDTEKRKASPEKKKNRVKIRGSSLTVAPNTSDKKTRKKSPQNKSQNESKNSERNRKNRHLQTGCLCLRFYRMIVPISFSSISKYRSRTNNNSSSIKKKSRGSSQKKRG